MRNIHIKVIIYTLCLLLCLSAGIVSAQDGVDHAVLQQSGETALTAPENDSLPTEEAADIEETPIEEIILTEAILPTGEVTPTGETPTEEVTPTEAINPTEEVTPTGETPTVEIPTEEVTPTETPAADSEDDPLAFPMGSGEPEQCGDSVYWQLSNEVLHFSGSGEIWHADRFTDKVFPWRDLQFKKIEFAEEITLIPANAFLDSNLGKGKFTVEFPLNLRIIEAGAFSKSAEGLILNMYGLEIKNLDFTHYQYLVRIDKKAFYGSGSLQGTLRLPAGVILGEEAFAYTGIEAADLFKMSITEIPSKLFEYCSSLAIVSLPEKIKQIGNGAFQYTSGLTSLDLSSYKDLEEIGSYAFRNSSLSYGITLPDSLSFVGCNAFEGSGIKSIDLSNTLLTVIIDSMFQNCKALTSVTFPSDLTTICQEAFKGTTGLTSLDLSSYKKLTEIRTSAFESSSLSGGITLPSSLSSLGEIAFKQSGLTSIDLSNTALTSIDRNVFSQCNSLTSVIFPTTLNYINSGAFSNCSNLTAVHVENNMNTINFGWGAFSGVPTRTSAPKAPCTFYGSTGDEPVLSTAYNDLNFDIWPKKQVGDNVYWKIENEVLKLTGSGAMWELDNANYPAGTTNFPWAGKTFTSVSFDNAVTTIPAKAFKDNFVSVNNFPTALTTIGAEAFSGNNALTALDLSSCTSLTTIGESAFKNNTALTSVTLPSSLTTLGDSAFLHTAISSIDLSVTQLTSIGARVFEECTNLVAVAYPATDKLTSIGAYAFFKTKVTSAALNDYEKLTSIGEHAYYGTGLKELTLPKSLTTIGTNAFGCHQLSEVNLRGTQVTDIPSGAFAQEKTAATKLAKVYVDNTLNTIDRNAFNNVPTLSSANACVFYGTTGEEPSLQVANLLNFDYEPKKAGAEVFWKIDGTTLKFTGEGAMWELEEYPGKPTQFPWDSKKDTFTAVTFDDAVTTIPNKAFNVDYKSLTSVTFPASLKSIGESAFHNCNITMEGADFTKYTQLETIKSKAFYSAENITGALTLPDTVKNLGDNVFARTGITSADLSALPITKIPDGLFTYCRSLATVSLPADTKEIGKEAFKSTGALNLDLSAYTSLETIDQNAFEASLSNVACTLPSSLKSLGVGAFKLSGITSLDLSKTQLASISPRAFQTCSLLTSVIFPANLTAINQMAFAYCTELKKISNLTSLKEIGDLAFFGCEKLTEVHVEENKNKITVGGDCFAYVPTITEHPKTPVPCTFYGATGDEPALVLADSLDFDYEPKKAGDKVFWKIEGTTLKLTGSGAMWELSEYPGGTATKFPWAGKTYTSVSFDDAVTTIPAKAFYLQESCKSVTFPANLTSIGANAFEASGIEDADLSACTKLKEIGEKAFILATCLKSVVLPDGLETIGDYAFQECGPEEGTVEVTFTTSLKTIGKGAFTSSCLASADLAATAVTEIKEQAFKDCSVLRSVELPDSLIKIGEEAFNNCGALQSIDLSTTKTTTIGDSAFADCKTLETVKFPSNLETIGKYAFQETKPATVDLSVATKLTTIDSFAFDSIANLSTVTFPETNTLKVIGDNSFRKTGLTSVDLSKLSGLQEILEYTFSECGSLLSVTFPESLKKIHKYAFNQSDLRSVDLSATVLESIDESAFQDCAKLATVKFPTALKNIVKNAFKNDSKLTEVRVEGITNTITIDDSAFTGVPQLGSATPCVFYGSTGDEPALVRAAELNFDYEPKKCGKTVFWKIESSELKFYGDGGAMWELSEYPGGGAMKFPWDGKIYTSVSFDDAVTTIPAGAFKDNAVCVNNFPTALTAIGAEAFSGNTALTALDLSTYTSLTTIGDSAFKENTALASVTLPSSLTTLGDSAFRKTAISAIDLSGTQLTSVGSCVFFECADLKTVTYPAKDKLTSIGDSAFYKTQVKSADLKEYEKLTIIEESAYFGTGLTTLTLPKSLTTIGGNAFNGHELSEVNLRGTQVTKLDMGTFAQETTAATKLAKVYVDDTLTTIGKGAFQNVPELPSADACVFYGTTGDEPSLPLADARGFDYEPKKAGKKIFWKYNKTSNTLRFTGEGPMWELDEYPSGSLDEYPWSKYSSEIQIINFDDAITIIPDKAFYSHGALTGIDFPTELTSIGNEAFMYASLTDLDLSETKVTSIGESAFATSYMAPIDELFLKSVKLPSTLKTIGKSVFKEQKLLPAIDLSMTAVTVIPESAFEQCASLTTVVYPANLTSIGKNAFYKTAVKTAELKDFPKLTTIEESAYEFCALSTLTLPSSLTTIGKKAFKGNELTEFSLRGTKVKEIPEYAFNQATPKLKKVEVDDTLTVIADNAFEGVTPLPEVDACVFYGVTGDEPALVRADALNFDYEPKKCGKTVFWKIAGTELQFYGNGGAMWELSEYPGGTATKFPWVGKTFTSVSFVDTVTTIPAGAFTAAVGQAQTVSTVTFPTALTSIGADAFANNAITQAELANCTALVNIGDGAFSGCDKLTTATFPAALQKIGKSAFAETALTSLTLDHTKLNEIADEAFSGTDLSNGLTLPTALTKIGSQAFAETKVKKVELANSKVTTIGDKAFNNCTDLAELTLPTVLQKIGQSAFTNTAIDELNLTATKVTEIGSSAFEGCAQLASLTFPTTLKALGASAFSGTAIEEVNLRDTALTSLPEMVFGNTAKLMRVLIKGKLTYASIDDKAFDGAPSYDTTNSPCTFYGITGDEPELVYAKNHQFEYEPKKAGPKVFWRYTDSDHTLTFTGTGPLWETDHWNGDFPWANKPYQIIDFDDAITNVPGSGFTCSATHNELTTVDLPNALVTIGASAFAQCANLADLELPAAVLTIGDSAFQDCAKIGDVTFPVTLQTIGNYAFNATNLTKAELIGTKVTSIGDHAFDACADMTAANFPATLQTIGASAFTGTQLTEAELDGTKVTTIGDSAFEGLSGFNSVTFPTTLQTIGDKVFKGTALTAIEISKTKLTSIGASAFEGVAGIENIDFPATLKTLGESVFKGTGLKKLVLKNTAVKVIPEHAFEDTPMNSDQEHDSGCWVRDDTTFIAESAFDNVDRALWWYGKGGTYQINWALAHGFNAVPSTGVIIGIKFDFADPSFYDDGDFRLVVSQNGKILAETMIPGFKDFKLSLPERVGGILKAEIFNSYDQLVGQATRAMDAIDGLVLVPEDFMKLSHISAKVLLPDGTTDITSQATIGWADEEGHSFPIGTSLKYVPVNTPMTCTAKLNLAADPYLPVPDSITKLIVEDETENVFTFTAYHAVTAEGDLRDALDPQKPVSGAKVRFIQTLYLHSATYEMITEAVSDANGHFMMKDTYGKAGKLEVIANGYVFYTTDVTDDDAAVGTLGAHDLIIDEGSLDIHQEDMRAPLNGSITLNYDIAGITAPEYRVYDENKKLYEDMTDKPVSAVSIDTVNQTVTVTNAGEAGAAYVEIYGTSAQGVEHSDLCRVEFYQEIRVQSAYSTLKTVKINPYKIETVNIPVVIGLDGTADVTNEGSLISEAAFVDSSVPFDLRVADDNTLEVCVRDADITAGKVYEGSYKSEISVKLNLNGTEVTKTLTNDKGKSLMMTVKVNKKLPKVKVTTPVFNSAFDNAYNLLTISGGKPTKVEFDNTLPTWLETKTDDQNVVNGLISHAAKNLKTKLLLPVTVTLDGWRVPFTATLKAQFAPSLPKITVKMNKGSLHIGTDDVMEGKFIFSEDKYKEFGGDIEFLRVVDGKTAWNADSTSCPLILSQVDSEQIIVKNNLDNFRPDGKNHNYTVYYKLANGDSEYTFKVKTVGAAPIEFKTTSKNTIDLSIPGSYAIVTVDVKNFAACKTDIPELKFYRNCKDAECTFANEVYDMFDVKAPSDGSGKYIVRLSNTFTDSMFSEGDTFVVRPYQCFTDTCNEMKGNSELVTIKGANMKVLKSDPIKVAPKITALRIKGRLEPSNPASSITVTPVIKNWPNYQADPSDLVFYADGMPIKGNALPFSVTAEGDHFVIRRHSDAQIDMGKKYSVSFNTILNGQSLFYPKKGSTAIAVKNSGIKLTINVKSLTLYKVDPSYVETFTVDVVKPVGGTIAKAELTGKTAKYFELMQRPDGVFTIGFKNAQFPIADFEKTKSVGVQINIWLDGNGSQKADKKISLSIALK